jgi:hypothetical protein
MLAVGTPKRIFGPTLRIRLQQLKAPEKEYVYIIGPEVTSAISLQM